MGVNNKIPKDSLGVRLDFDFQDGELVLVGLAMDCFGWILGGNKSGTVTVRSHIPLDKENIIQEKGSKPQLGRVRQLVRSYDYNIKRRNYPVGEPK